MPKTCTITASARIGDKILAEKRWVGVDVMRIGHTREWCTRKLNEHRQDHVRIEWECWYDQPADEGGDWRHHFDGSIVRIQGSLFRKGICEEWPLR